MARLDKSKGGRHEMLSLEAKKRIVKGGKICTICKEVRKLDEYYNKQTYCKVCSKRMNRERHQRHKYKLW